MTFAASTCSGFLKDGRKYSLRKPHPHTRQNDNPAPNLCTQQRKVLHSRPNARPSTWVLQAIRTPIGQRNTSNTPPCTQHHLYATGSSPPPSQYNSKMRRTAQILNTCSTNVPAAPAHVHLPPRYGRRPSRQSRRARRPADTPLGGCGGAPSPDP